MLSVSWPWCMCVVGDASLLGVRFVPPYGCILLLDSVMSAACHMPPMCVLLVVVLAAKTCQGAVVLKQDGCVFLLLQVWGLDYYTLELDLPACEVFIISK